MILKTLKTKFTNALIEHYPETEVNSFFNLLAEHVLKLKRIDIALNLYMVVSKKKCDKFEIAIERILNYEPIQYVLGEIDFYGMRFKVNKSVLIPRPETEELVDWIIKENRSKTNISILDIGTGSGCIAVSLAKHLPESRVFALDVSKDALKVARINAKKNGVALEFIEANILNSNFGDFKFDIIVSNPPYVRESEKELMSDNVLEHEPHLALFVKDDDALLFYRKIIQISRTSLKEKGLLYFEINEHLGEGTRELVADAQFIDIELKQDIFGKDRMIKAVK